MQTHSANRAATEIFNRQQKQRTADAEAISAYYSQIRERNIQKIIVDFLEKAQIPYMRNRDVKLVKTKSGEIVPARLAESQRGKPDLTVVLSDRQTIWIETKAPNGKLRPEQERWRDDLIKRGHEWHAPRTPDEAAKICERILFFMRMGR